MTSTTIADDRQIIEACRGLESDITRFLMDLVRFDSLPAREGPAMHWVHEQFGGLADICELVPVPESLTKDPDYQSVVVAPFEGRPNVRVVVKGDGGGAASSSTRTSTWFRRARGTSARSTPTSRMAGFTAAARMTTRGRWRLCSAC